MEEVPEDDELHLYIIATEDESWSGVAQKLFDKYNLEVSDYTLRRVMELLEKQTNNTVIDSWDSGEVVYVLHRLDRDFYEPLMEFYLDNYNNMSNLVLDEESNIDHLLNSHQYSDVIQAYIELIDNLLDEESELYALKVLTLLNDLFTVLDKFSLESGSEFKELVIGEGVGDNSWTHQSKGEGNFDRMVYEITFYEGWSLRERRVSIPIKDGYLNFVPTIPEVTGEYSLSGRLSLPQLEELLLKAANYDFYDSYVSEYRIKLDSVYSRSTISLIYNVISNYHRSTKIIAFNNDFIHEGILRFLLDVEYETVTISPRNFEEESMPNYFRDINRITSNSVDYLILARDVLVDDVVLDEGALYKLEVLLEVVDLHTFQTIWETTVRSEFLSDLDSRDLAYLDFGLKLGEVIYTLEF